MANSSMSISYLRGNCIAPFFDPSRFPIDEGYVGGRICSKADMIKNGLTCCLPCPVTDYIYPQSFVTWSRVAEGISIASLAACVFLLVSFLYLPAEKTRRHYLSYCLTVAIMLLHLGFVVPFASRPPQCANAITPNDMYTNLTCAFSGAFIIAGGLGTGVWIFVRALSMHLQICWDIMPGQKFFYTALGLGWGITAALFTVTITITGVSFRFGDACHVNSIHSMKDFWGPMLGFAGLSTLIQLATFVYCINVYLKNMWSDDATATQSSAGLPSYTNSVRTKSAKDVYRRVRKVLWLQWRGMTIVVLILIDVIFFSVVFIYLDTTEQALLDHAEDLMPFVLCLVRNPSNVERCHAQGQKLLVNQTTVTAILVLLSLPGIQLFFLLIRGSFFTGWAEAFRNRFSKRREFVSLDAKRFSGERPYETAQQRSYELHKVEHGQVRSPAPAYTSPVPPSEVATYPGGGWDRDGASSPEFYSKEAQREYRSPDLSFSAPRAPSQTAQRKDWDPKSSHARGGLGFHPPAEGREDDRDYKI